MADYGNSRCVAHTCILAVQVPPYHPPLSIPPYHVVIVATGSINNRGTAVLYSLRLRAASLRARALAFLRASASASVPHDLVGIVPSAASPYAKVCGPNRVCSLVKG